MCGRCIRKFWEVLSGDRITQNALWIVVNVVNRLAYFRLTHNAKHMGAQATSNLFPESEHKLRIFDFVVPSLTIVEKR